MTSFTSWLGQPLNSAIFWLLLSGFTFGLFTWIVPLFTRKTRTVIDDIIVGILRIPVTIIVFVYGALRVLQSIPQIETWITVANKVYIFIIIWVITWLILRVIVDIVKRYVQEHAEQTESNIDDVVAPLVTSAGPLFMVVIASILTIRVFSPELLGQLLTVIGALSFLLVFLFQEPLSNLFSGVYLWLGSPFKYGDMVTLECGETYRVENIGVRVTRLYNTSNHKVVFLPNSQLAQQQLVNQTRPNFEMRDRFIIGIAYGTASKDIPEIQEMMVNIANSHPHTLGVWDSVAHDSASENSRLAGSASSKEEVRSKKELILERIETALAANDKEEADHMTQEYQRLQVEYRMRDKNQVIWEKLLSMAQIISYLECEGLNKSEKGLVKVWAEEIQEIVDSMRRDLTIWVRWTGLLQAVYKLPTESYPPLSFIDIEQGVATPDECASILNSTSNEAERIAKFLQLGKIPLIGSFPAEVEFLVWGPSVVSKAYRLCADNADLSISPHLPAADDWVKSAAVFEDWKRLHIAWSRACQELLKRLENIHRTDRVRREKMFLLDEYINETAARFKNTFMLKVPGYQQPDVDFIGFGESRLDFELSYYVDDLIGDHFERLGDVRGDIGLAIKETFDIKNIEIPRSQREVWFRNSLTYSPDQPTAK